MKTTTRPSKNSINRSSRPLTLLLIPFALGCFAFLPPARAVCDITNFDTFLGDDALLNNTGSDNTAIGHLALTGNTTGNANTAVGSNNIALGSYAGLNRSIGIIKCWT